MIAWLLTVALGAETVHADAAAWDAWLAATHADAVARATWRSPTGPERDAWIAGVTGLAQAREDCAPTPQTVQALDAAGFALTEHRIGAQRALVVVDRGHGAGMLAVACGARPELLVQAPHPLYDVHTDDLARHALTGGVVRAAWWATVHRYRATPGETEADPIHPADATRHPTSPLQTASLAWLAAVPSARVVQLHGFGDGHTAAQVVLSSGDATRPPVALEAPVAGALGVGLDAVEVYGADGRVLGGAENALARRLRTAPAARFLHVELARPLRDALAGDAAATSRLLGALGAAPWAF